MIDHYVCVDYKSVGNLYRHSLKYVVRTLENGDTHFRSVPELSAHIFSLFTHASLLKTLTPPTHPPYKKQGVWNQFKISRHLKVEKTNFKTDVSPLHALRKLLMVKKVYEDHVAPTALQNKRKNM